MELGDRRRRLGGDGLFARAGALPDRPVDGHEGHRDVHRVRPPHLVVPAGRDHLRRQGAVAGRLCEDHRDEQPRRGGPRRGVSQLPVQELPPADAGAGGRPRHALRDGRRGDLRGADDRRPGLQPHLGRLRVRRLDPGHRLGRQRRGPSRPAARRRADLGGRRRAVHLRALREARLGPRGRGGDRRLPPRRRRAHRGGEDRRAPHRRGRGGDRRPDRQRPHPGRGGPGRRPTAHL